MILRCLLFATRRRRAVPMTLRSSDRTSREDLVERGCARAAASSEILAVSNSVETP